ncbi:MAG: Rad52/Rad22 family DNA repair protein [Gemmatimonadaceae bacterium]
MIARQDAYIEKTDVWAKLSAPVPSGAISWRQDGKVTARDGKHFARFVAYIEANTVRERLDAVVPGEWDLTLELLPAIAGDDGDGALCSFKARLQILGVIREDVGTGRDYKQASTDAFKRAAVRFGVANELYAYEQNWVEMDGDGKYAKPLEDPQRAYMRRYGKPGTAALVPATNGSVVAPSNGNSAPATALPASTLTDMEIVSCPKCGGRMWDNRLTKRNPKAPDYKCQNRSCDGVIWPPKGTAVGQPADAQSDRKPAAEDSALVGSEEELPF